jgi:hypothetical protein
MNQAKKVPSLLMYANVSQRAHAEAEEVRVRARAHAKKLQEINLYRPRYV